MTQSHYSLRWNNHQSHILAAFDALLQAETLVDVTLVCAETSVRAHKVVLSACSPFFQRIFAENPCKHPVIVLKDFNGWEVQAIVDFMYKGEISVGQEQLQSLIKAAESLQVRGLANQDPFGIDRPPTTGHESIVAQTPTPSASPTTEPFCCGGREQRGSSPFSPLGGGAEARPAHATQRLAFPYDGRGECQSPVPRRKQARPRRRSGELGVDLSGGRSPGGEEMLAENLCVKRKDDKKEDPETPPRLGHHHRGPPSATPEPPGSTRSPDSLDGPRMEYRVSPGAGPQTHGPPSGVGAALNLKRELEEGAAAAGLPFPPMPSVSALAMTQSPHTKFFGLDSPLGLFPPGLDRNPLFDMPDPRTTPDVQMFAKKKNSFRGNFPVGRPKGQHSAPRGGPPRSWTNAELTEALQHVWNKKMTTSQASRIFGIPYNSLLMYVRGKYGKSLKLEQLRKDCIGEGGPTPPMDILSMSGANNNNTCKPERESEQQNNNRPPSREVQQDNQPQHPLFNPFQHSFYPDFGTGFPIPVSMVHLLPQSEKSRDGHYLTQAQPHAPSADDVKKEEDDEYDRPASMQIDDHRRELVHQNGQD